MACAGGRRPDADRARRDDDHDEEEEHAGMQDGVTRDTHLNTFPSFLPDGRIAFASRPQGGPETLVTVDPEGKDRRDLGLETFFARWSPDGTRIAFLAGTWPRSTLHVARADGSEARQIVP